MKIILHYYITTKEALPSPTLCKKYIHATLKKIFPRFNKTFEISIRFVSAKESRTLNKKFRKKDYATNVLSFPNDEFDTPESREASYLGDLAICSSVVQKESIEQGKSSRSHFAHLIVHGVLHLLGYDHMKSRDAKKMENLEIAVLKNLKFENPYS